MSDLTPRQEQYFDILESLDPSPELQRSIELAKEDLRRANGDNVVRGLTRVKGFTPNND